MRKASFNGVGLHYQYRRSNGPDVVLVHGLATSLAFWYPKIASLLMRDYCLTLYDLRGHGRSDMPQSGYTTADMVADLHALLEHLQINQAHLVGHSYGGAIALHYTALHPDHVASLTLADVRVRALQPTMHFADRPNVAAWRDKLAELRISTSAEMDETDAEMGFRFLEMIAKARVGNATKERQSTSLFASVGSLQGNSRTAQQWLQLLQTTTANRDFLSPAGLTVEMIQTVSQPVLAIYGEFSNCLPSCWGLKQHLPHCKVVIVPGAGHFYPIERPTLFVSHLRMFLKGLAS